MSEHKSKPKYLWFLTKTTDLQEHKSVILHLYSWIFVYFIGGKVCLNKECSKIVDHFKLMNELLLHSQLSIDFRSFSMHLSASFQESSIQIKKISPAFIAL